MNCCVRFGFTAGFVLVDWGGDPVSFNTTEGVWWWLCDRPVTERWRKITVPAQFLNETESRTTNPVGNSIFL